MTDPSTSKAGMWVSFLITPLAALVASFVAHAALSVFGVHLDPTATATYMTGIMLGVVALGFKWVHNRGRYEVAHLLGTKVQNVDQIAALLEERLPAPPSSPAPGAGSPTTPRAPGA